MKIFGTGWAKTGTTTLGVALARLGWKHRSQDLGYVDAWCEKRHEEIFAETDRWESFDDWPWLLMYQQFEERYPDARFVLTVRDETQWMQSYKSMLADQGKATERMNVIRRKLYGLPFPDVSENDLLARYRKHNEDVISYFSDKPGKLLVADWSAGHGYPELCSFVGVPVLDEPFPHANKAVDRKLGILRRVARKLHFR